MPRVLDRHWVTAFHNGIVRFIPLRCVTIAARASQWQRSNYCRTELGATKEGGRPLAWCVTLSWCPIYHEWEVLIPLFVLCLNVMNQCAAQINWNSSLLTLPDVVLIYLFNGSCWEIILSWYESQCKMCRRRKDCVCKGTAFSLPWRIFEVRKKYDKYRENLWNQV